MKFLKSVFILCIGFYFGWQASIYLNKKPDVNQFFNRIQTIEYSSNSNQSSISQQPIVVSPVKNKAKDPIEKSIQAQLISSYKQKNWDNVARLLSNLSLAEQHEPEMLMLKARYLIEHKYYFMALEQIEKIYAQPQELYSETLLKKQILQLLSLYKKHNSVQNNPEEAIKFIESLLNLEPQLTDIHYQLALVLAQNNFIDKAKDELNYLIKNNYLEKKVKSLQQLITRHESFLNGVIRLPLIYQNKSWLINANTQNNNLTLLLDTGANSTLIAIESLENFAQQEEKKSVTIQTAGGLSNAYISNIKELSVGNIVDKDFPILVIQKSQLPKGIDGLLGVDWLGRFKFYIDQNNNELHLELKE